MERYKIVISPTAKQDLIHLSNIIRFEYKSPITATQYLKGIYNEIKRLSQNADTFKIQTHCSFLQYGKNVRRINYKKMTIIYTVVGNTTYIQRVVPSSTIISL
jgi:plasmid stabilization system protein ParE